MLDLRALEMAGHQTWPAFHEEWSGEWIIRATNGMSRRNNSVTPMGPAAVPLPNAIEWAESWLTEHEVAPIFRMTDLAPPELGPMLEQRGYHRADTTLVMAKPIGQELADPDVDLSRRPSPQWLDVVIGSGARSPQHRKTLHKLLGTSPYAAFAELRAAGRVVAIGSTAVAGTHAAIFNMNTLPTHRRRGIATKILHTLLAHAHGHGATHALLQVRDDNPPAIAFYEREGFAPAYQYWYYE